MTDKELLKVLKKNKDKGLSETIDLYAGLVYKIVSAVVLPVGSHEDAEECVNDVFLAFYQSRDKIDLEKASVKTYLAVISKRKAIDVYRKLKRNNTVSFEQGELPFSQKEDFSLSLERKELLLNAVKGLGEPDTTIITCRYFLGESIREIGERVHLSDEAVQKRIERSRLKLKKELGGVLNG